MFALLGFLAAEAGAIWLFVRGVRGENPTLLVSALVLFIVASLGLAGIFAVYPNESKVLTLFGRYVGTVKEPGLWWANPFNKKEKISVRVRNFETAKLKVNDNHGNPIEIGAVVVWQVIDTAEALFEVDDYQNFVKIQSEAALRGLATRYPYDSHGESISLSGNTTEVSNELMSHVQERLAKAGVRAIEARISHLAYAPEIAQAMLQRQQASAIIAARQKIVEGAVGMVEMALTMLAEKSVVALDDERRAAMVSNLLVVLCGDRATQPVVNTGTLYT
ncbi:MAG: SPFH domain-containing protein [Gemmatimonadetes bacterium]|nr:SPFH domain-containing protein [Gemmatimonadota bacterium]